MNELRNERECVFLLDGTASRLPIFWEALTHQGECIRQIGPDGEIAARWSALEEAQLRYFGLVCQRGRFGIYIPSLDINCNGVRSEVGGAQRSLEERDRHAIRGITYVRRHISDSHTGHQQTWFTEIGVGIRRLAVILYPDFHIKITDADVKTGEIGPQA